MKEQTTIEKQITPAGIMQVGMGFWASKTLLAAVNLEIFTHLSLCPLTAEEIQVRTGIQKRGLLDFLDALVALGFLNRQGFNDEAFYSNTEETELFLDKRKPTYMGGMLEMANNRLYKFWGALEEGLKTGLPQNEIKDTGVSLFESIYQDHRKLKEFSMAMQGVQMGSFITLSKQFDFSGYATLCDIGGSSGALSIQVASENPHMRCISADLPELLPIAQENISDFGLKDRIEAVNINFFQDDLPKADVITMGNILHDWNLEDKKMLIKKAYEALPEGGAFIVIENVIDDDRRENAFGLMMSLNMLIETEGGFDFTRQEFAVWAEEIGFAKIETMPLAGPTSAIIAIK